MASLRIYQYQPNNLRIDKSYLIADTQKVIKNSDHQAEFGFPFKTFSARLLVGKGLRICIFKFRAKDLVFPAALNE